MTVAAIALLVFLSLVTRWTFRFVAEMRERDSDQARVEMRNQALVDLDRHERSVADEAERARESRRVSLRQDCIIVPVGPDRSWSDYESARNAAGHERPEDLRNALFPELRK